MISAKPDVKVLTLNEEHDFMVIACDGIWYVLHCPYRFYKGDCIECQGLAQCFFKPGPSAALSSLSHVTIALRNVMSSQEVVNFVSERIKPNESGKVRALSSIVEEVRQHHLIDNGVNYFLGGICG